MSIHIYFPILIENFEMAIVCHLNVLSSTLKTLAMAVDIFDIDGIAFILIEFM